MPEQPHGTITFLFTDIEGSTRLWEEYPRAMQIALARHDALLRAAIETHHGYVFKTIGDAFCAAFPTAPDALAAALTGQRALRDVDWTSLGIASIQARMALHTGVAETRDGDYFGPPLNRVARLLGSGSGGQVLLSLAAEQLVRDHLPPETSLRDLGTGGLRDLKRPEHIYQLVAPDLRVDFPPLKVLDPNAGSAASVQAVSLQNPYKGLRAFHEKDAPDFFGRETLTQRLLTRLAEATPFARFLAVVGPSGSGKSSVVRAGVVPALKAGALPGAARWLIVEMLPGAHPLEELEAVLLGIAVNPPESLLGQLKEDERGLARAVKRVLPRDESVELVVVIDQFEEVFTLVEAEAERVHFLSSLYGAVTDPRSRLRVITTLRADFYDRPLLYPDPGELLRQRTEVVLPLSAEELERAIVRPAGRVGARLETELVAAIIKDVGEQPGALPLLQYALTELFERRSGRLLTLEAYRESGGVLGALGRRAEEIYAGLDEKEQAVARQLFLRLVTLGEGVEDTRRRVRRSELAALTTADRRPLTAENPPSTPAAVDAVLDTFGRYRLLTFDRDPITRGPTVEVAHEALIRTWGRLREWLAASRANLRVQRQMQAAAGEWAAAGEDESFLASGARLAQFEALAGEGDLALTGEERRYLAASVAEREWQARFEAERQARELETAQRAAEAAQAAAAAEKRRAEEQERAARVLRQRAVYLTSALVVAGLLAVVALFFGQQATARQAEADTQRLEAVTQRNASATAQADAVAQRDTAEQARADAELQRQTAFARELAVNAVANLDVDPERSILLALQAVSVSSTGGRPVLREAEEALHRAVQTSRVQLTLRGHTSTLRSVAYSPDGKRLATGSNDRTAKVWDAATGQELLTLVGHTAQVQSVVFSPDGARVATASSDQTAKVWDAVTGKELRTLRGHTDEIQRVAYSPNGRRLVTAAGRAGSAPSIDHTAKVWDAMSGELLLTFTGHNGSTRGIRFSPDGRRAVSAIDDGTAKVWDVATGEVLLTLTGHVGVVYDAVFSPDSNRLATAGADRTLKVWDAATGQSLLTLYGHASTVWSVAFNQAGTRLYSASLDGTAKVWDAASGQPLFTLAGHTGGLRGLALSPDGTRIATASDDNTAKVWDVTPVGDKEWLTLTGHTALIAGAVFSPDGTHMATSSADNTAKVWDAMTGQELLTFAGHRDQIRGIVYSPDGRRLATASFDSTAKVWDAATGEVLLTLSTQEAPYVQGNGITFSPDGRRIATSSAGNTAKIWDATTGKELLTLAGHSGRVLRLAFSPDGKRIATASETPDQTAKVWDSATGKELLTLKGHNGGVYTVVFSPDGARLATSSADGTAKIWDAATGKEWLTLTGHTGQVNGLAISSDGARLATVSNDLTIKVWNITLERNAIEQPLTLYGGGSRTVAFSPDGRRLLTGDANGIARVYALPIEDIVAIAKTRVTRELTCQERQTYLHEELNCP